MRNTLVRVLLVAVGACAFTVAPAQDSAVQAQEDQLLADARTLLQEGRKDIVGFELHLSDEEAAAFWPVYDDYRKSVLENRNRYADLIVEYVRRHRAGDISEAYAAQLIDDVLDVKADLVKRQKKFVKRFRKVLPVRKVARFYQLEQKLDAEIDAQLAVVVPLMDPV
ncbi:MAG: hypothetical protein WB812_11415 [Woeseiaceae bacterium]